MPATSYPESMPYIEEHVAGDLKAGQIEIRDLLARVVARLEGV